MDTCEASTVMNTAEVEEMLKKLGIAEDDFDDVVVEEEEELPAEAIQWMAIARVHIEKTYAQYWFSET